LLFANRGQLLFLSNDSGLLAIVLNRLGATPFTGTLTYAAGFRHSRERANYERVMAALDFASAGRLVFRLPDISARAPAFFSDNIGSLSQVLSKLAEIRMTQEERGGMTAQTVVYQMGQ
jgi:hypothetical protein